MLATQVKYNAQERLKSREDDISYGRQLVEAELEKSTREAQMEAYKRHKITKTLREAWANQ